VFPASTDLSVGEQTAARAPFVLSVSGIHGGEGWRFGMKTKESLIRSLKLRMKNNLVNRQEHLAPTVGSDLKQ